MNSAAARSQGLLPAKSRPRARDFWAYQPVHRPPTPAVKQASWRDPTRCLHPGKTGSQGFESGRPGRPRSLAAAGDLRPTGLPPTPEEIDAFSTIRRPMPMSNCSIDCSRRRTMAKSGAGTGSTWCATPRPMATNATAPNRSPGVIAITSSTSFNDDKPYDRFVKEQLAGDELPDHTPTRSWPRVTIALALGRRTRRPRAGPLRRIRRSCVRHDRPGVSRHDAQLCPLPRSQDRPDFQKDYYRFSRSSRTSPI